MGEDQADDEGHEDAAKGADDGAVDAGHPHTYEGGGVDGDGAWGHFCDGYEVGEFAYSHKVPYVYDLVLDKGNGCVAAAYTEEADLQETDE